ncbi:MAG: amino acid adenylation domain-containing protein, partial [Candidatus Dormibacteraeota bacterium]|nr:amino acid adenylation domain-containing protein [Candidatus Dormibacteraeota bacterium]
RTVFRGQDGEPVQVVLPPRIHRLPAADLSALPAAEAEAEARRLAERDAKASFDLEEGPLWRALLVRLPSGERRLQLTLFHAIFDGVSIYQVLLPELRTLHDAFLAGRPAELPEPEVQYPDFAVWEREFVGSPEARSQVDWWRQQLAGLPDLQLPTDRPRPARPSFRGAVQPLAFPPELVTALKDLCRQEGATLFMGLLAVFKVLLHHHSGQEDLVVGTVATARKRPELENILGYFLNPVVLRTDLSGEPSYRELLRRVREVTLAAYQHDDVPFEHLVRELAPRRGAMNPFFQVLLTLEPHTAATPSGWDLTTQFGVDDGSSKFDLGVELEERAEGLIGRLIYSIDLFEAATAERLAGDFQRVLERAVARPDARLAELAPRFEAELADPERRLPPEEWSRTAAEVPATSISRRFEEVAARWPDREAVSFGGERLSYAELDARANQLAHSLQARGVIPDTPVGVCVGRSLEMVIALLGVLKAGGAYVPLDPAYPSQRLQLLVERAGVRVAVTRDADAAAVPPGVSTVRVDAGVLDGLPVIAPEVGPAPNHLAYVLFTSGSTGPPKGVMVEHQSVIRLVCPATYAELGPDRVLLQLSALAFDLSTFEVWGALLNGGRLVVAPPGALSARELGEIVERERVTTLWLTGGFFNQVVDAGMPGLGGLSELLAGGEALSAPHCRRALELLPETRLINGYGPTEATTFACCHTVRSQDLDGGVVPIGRPIGNTTVRVLDERGEPVPVGATGELYIGGMGVARGYLGEPELTRERFLPDPSEPGGRLYRSGDLVRWRPEGVLEFLGRRDRQVKVRGFRIELNEVESALAAHPELLEAVVEAPADGSFGRRLVAYVVGRGGRAPDREELDRFLGERLPRHMLPSEYIPLDSLPLNASGKVDRKALPASSSRRPEAVPDKPGHGPGTPLEEELAGIWARLLDIDEVDREESFFSLGGHSLLAVNLVAEVERHFGRPLPLAAVFGDGSTVAGMARLLEEPGAPPAVDSPLLVPVRAEGSRPPLFVIEPNEGPLMALRHFLPFLHPEQPVLAMLPPTIGGRFERETSVEAMGEELLQVLRQVQPRGPYRLAGYSLGGILAYHLAWRLRQEGEVVEFVGLIDAMTPELGLRHSDPFISFGTRVRRLLQTSPRHWPRMLWGGLVRELRLGAAHNPWEGPAANGVAFDAQGALALERTALDRVVFDAEGALALLEPYRLPASDVRLTLFGSRWQQRWVRDHTLGWGRVHQGPLEVEMVAGDHRTIMIQPHVSDLARRFARYVEALDRPDSPGGPRRPLSSRVSVVVPARNEAANLPHVLRRIPNWVDEVVLVDGGSSDGTVDIARRLWPGVRIVHQKGRGKGAALRQGCEAATGEMIVAMDADGSTDPAEIPLYVGGLLGGADFVKGSRYIQGGGSSDLSRLRSLGNLGLTVVTRLLYRNSFSDL